MMHGPGTYEPSYPDVPTIRVEDGVVGSLRFRKGRRWRKHRDRALALWEQAGLRFDVMEIEPLTFVGLGEPDHTPGGGVSSEVVEKCVAGRITLVRSKYTPPAPKWWPTAWAYWNRSVNGTASFFHLERLKRSEKLGAPTYAWDRTICHEVGHNLGLDHGGRGIMSGGMVPNAHDLDSVRAYYRT